MKTYLKKSLGNELPNNQEKHIPAKLDKNPDPTKKTNEPKKTDPTRIDKPTLGKSR
jgi:hypothetical protein